MRTVPSSTSNSGIICVISLWSILGIFYLSLSDGTNASIESLSAKDSYYSINLRNNIVDSNLNEPIRTYRGDKAAIPNREPNDQPDNLHQRIQQQMTPHAGGNVNSFTLPISNLLQPAMVLAKSNTTADSVEEKRLALAHKHLTGAMEQTRRTARQTKPSDPTIESLEYFQTSGRKGSVTMETLSLRASVRMQQKGQVISTNELFFAEQNMQGLQTYYRYEHNYSIPCLVS